MRTIAILVPILLLGCASAPPRPAMSAGPASPPDTVVRVPDQRFLLRLPHDWWLQAEDGDDETTTLVHERRQVTVTVTSRALDGSGFVATADIVRREAIDAGCGMRRGHATYVTDQFGRRTVMAMRRMIGGEVEDGEVTVLALEGREGVLVVTAWWPESPSHWMTDDVHDIVDSIRILPGT